LNSPPFFIKISIKVMPAKSPQPKVEKIQIPKWTVSIPKWRNLGIEEFHIETTYGSFLEGTTQGINLLLMRGLVGRVESKYFAFEKQMNLAEAERRGKKPPKKIRFPLHLPKPTAEEMLHPFPAFFCMAAVTGHPVENAKTSPDAISSRVYCCWFTDDINLPVTELVRKGIRPFDWDAVAENCEL